MNRYHASSGKRRKKEKAAQSDWPVPEAVQNSLSGYLSEEFAVLKRNNKALEDDFEVYYNMIHGIRERKVNEWESDIYLPEFLSRLLTQIGNFVAQYFASTDYVDVDLDSDDPRDVAEAKAGRDLLNSILNDKRTYYYAKIVRLIMFVFSCGYGIVKGGYRQEVVKEISHYEQKSEWAVDEMTGQPLAENGLPYTDPTLQKPLFNVVEEPVLKDKIIEDRPTFDVYPVQNVYMSPEYAYSLNDKEEVVFETEMSLSGLRDAKDELQYFNLDLLAENDPEGKRGESTYNKDGSKEPFPNPVDKTFTVLERWGKFPVKEGKDGLDTPGMEDDGSFSEGARLEECIITYAKERGRNDSILQVIGFRKSPHSRRPMCRFLCYVDMLNDCGFGDGKVNRELQKAVNDNYNLMNYRTKLAITPAFKGKRFAGIDENIRISPEKVTMLENLDDLQEWRIQDNIQGGVIHHNMLTSRMDYGMATSPQTMGMSPERGETATMASIIESRAGVRIGMKSMNLEFIGFKDLYDMLLSLCNDFMLPDTLESILGDKAKYYNPKRDDKFKPVSQALESEESKAVKLRTWQGLLGMVSSMQNPKTPMVVNYIIGQMLETMGKNFSHFKKFMFEEDPETVVLYQLATGASGGMGGAGSPPSMNPMSPPQNQNGMPMRQPEQNARMAANA